MSAIPPAQALAQEVVTHLLRAGLTDVVLAPGSRSAPMAYALAAAEAQGAVRLHVMVDERSAGFVALGLAVASGRPVAVVVTSGSAVANLHPAVVEAGHQRVGLLVISTDRPAELVARGASQTTDHLGIFGDGVGLSRPRATVEVTDRELVSGAVVRLLDAATGTLPGPVHLNLPLADPLVPAAPVPAFPPPQPRAAVAGACEIAALRGADLPEGPATVVIAADGAPPGIAEFAAERGWPLLAEPSSGARVVGAMSAPTALLDALGHQVARAIVLGRPTLSRQVSALLGRAQVEVVIADPPGRAWFDVPDAVHLTPLGASPVPSSPRGLLPHSERESAGSGVRSDSYPLGTRQLPSRGGAVSLSAKWGAASQAVERTLASLVTTPPLAGWQIARLVSAQVAHDGGTLVAGASMAIRDLDLAMTPGARVVANRGLAGIDGTVSTAVGHALARGDGGGVRVLLGDLTLQHDIGALIRGRLERPIDLQLIVLSDDGGSIFATLEHGRPEHAAVHERVFATPQRLDLAALAAAVGAGYRRATTSAQVHDGVANPGGGVQILEVVLQRDGAAARRGELRARLVEAARESSGALG